MHHNHIHLGHIIITFCARLRLTLWIFSNPKEIRQIRMALFPVDIAEASLRYQFTHETTNQSPINVQKPFVTDVVRPRKLRE